VADPIKLVQGDTAPQVKATVTRSDTGAVVDVSDAVVKLHFRRKFTEAVLFSLTNQGSSAQAQVGVCIFLFASGNLDIDAGEYEGEIEVVFNGGARETVYEIISFVMREDFPSA
tara:strand:- start:339 stop:680 length:342 start_codon:yes stop_codon:yes gene_type:complete